jgi:hypothetical protein
LNGGARRVTDFQRHAWATPSRPQGNVHTGAADGWHSGCQRPLVPRLLAAEPGHYPPIAKDGNRPAANTLIDRILGPRGSRSNRRAKSPSCAAIAGGGRVPAGPRAQHTATGTDGFDGRDHPEPVARRP